MIDPKELELVQSAAGAVFLALLAGNVDLARQRMEYFSNQPRLVLFHATTAWALMAVSEQAAQWGPAVVPIDRDGNIMPTLPTQAHIRLSAEIARAVSEDRLEDAFFAYMEAPEAEAVKASWFLVQSLAALTRRRRDTPHPN